MEWVYSKDAARGTVMALDAQDLGRRVFNITLAALMDVEVAEVSAVLATRRTSALAVDTGETLAVSRPASSSGVARWRTGST